MLDIPAGRELPLAFASFDQTEVDALVEKNDRIFHVEFQIWNDETIRYRMLDYRNSLYKSYFCLLYTSDAADD